MNGEGELYYETGTFKGTYKNDEKHGPGTLTFTSGRKIEGLWVNGKQEGEGKFISENGKIRIGIWEKGRHVKWIKNSVEEKDQKTQP